MAATAKALREQRAKLIADARKILDTAEAEKRECTAEERQQWAKIVGDMGPDGKRIEGEEEKLKRRIDDIERQEALEHDLNKPVQGRAVPGAEGATGATGAHQVRTGPTEEQRAKAFAGWMRTQSGMDITDDQAEACKATGLNPRSREYVANLRSGDYRRTKSFIRRGATDGFESRAQASGLETAGGAFVPEGFVNAVEIALLQYGGIRSVADVMRTSGGGDLPWPTINDSTTKGAILSENAVVTGGDIVAGLTVLHAYKYSSKLVLIPTELLEDSVIDLPSTVGDLCGIRIGRIQSDHFTTGTGTAQPTGIMLAATSGVTGASSSAIASDDIYTLKHSVDPAYRQQGSGWMMNDQILLAVKKLKDGMGRPLWQTSLAGGAPDTLDGDPITINQSMDSTIASGKKTMAYGMFSKYKIRDVAEIRLRRLVERYADQDQEGFLMFMRSDANLLDAGTHPVKYMTH